MKRVFFIFVALNFSFASFANVASKEYVDSRVQVATRDTPGVVKMGEIPVGTSGNETAMMWVE